jgi:transcriptional regulator with XRE-family HTH domain
MQISDKKQQFYDKLNKRLIRLRNDRYLRKADVAKEIDTTKQNLALYESGENKVPLYHLDKLLELYGISFEEVLEYEAGNDADTDEELVVSYHDMVLGLRKIIKGQNEVITKIDKQLMDAIYSLANVDHSKLSLAQSTKEEITKLEEQQKLMEEQVVKEISDFEEKIGFSGTAIDKKISL